MLDQLKMALEILGSMQAEMLKILYEMGPEGMNWKIDLPEANSPYAIATHAAASQLWWIKENLHGEKIVRDRPAEFTSRSENLEALTKEIEYVQETTREIFETLRFEELQAKRVVRQKTYTGEWIVLHVIEHTALHLGHLQITRQLWEGKAAS